MSEERGELLEHIVKLGREFRRRGMKDHVRVLRVYYLAARAGLVGVNGKLDVHWSREMTEDWLRTLSVAPFDGAYEVKLPGVPCFKCRAPKGSHHSTARTELVFPGGARMRCDTCGARWVVLEEGRALPPSPEAVTRPSSSSPPATPSSRPPGPPWQRRRG